MYTPSQTVFRSVFLAGSCGCAGRAETPLVIVSTNVRRGTSNIEYVFQISSSVTSSALRLFVARRRHHMRARLRRQMILDRITSACWVVKFN